MQIDGTRLHNPAARSGDLARENVRAYVTLREGAERPSSADLVVFCRDRVGYKAPDPHGLE